MYKNLFPQANEVTYLDTAAEGLPLPGIEESFAEYCRAKARGTPGRREFHAIEAEVLSLVAQILETEPANVTLLGTASDALNLLAQSVKWKTGDQVITSDLEFPSNVLPWVRLKHSGVELIVIPTQDGALRSEQILERITTKTRLITLSLVSYKTGAYLPGIPEIAAAAKRAGAIFCVDATQALGRCPVCVAGIDYLMSSSFKWLLGPHGLGIVYISPDFRSRFNPATVGWYSVQDLFSESRFASYHLKRGAACLSAGMPNFPSIYALRRGIQFLLQVGIENIHMELMPVVERLREGLADLGLSLLTPAGREFASGIVSFLHPKPEEIAASLDEEGIIVWAGDGRVRASLHLYNDISDVDRYLEMLSSVLHKQEPWSV